MTMDVYCRLEECDPDPVYIVDWKSVISTLCILAMGVYCRLEECDPDPVYIGNGSQCHPGLLQDDLVVARTNNIAIHSLCDTANFTIRAPSWATNQTALSTKYFVIKLDSESSSLLPFFMSFLRSPYSIALLVSNVLVAYWLIGYLSSRTPNSNLPNGAPKGPSHKIPPTTLKYRDYTLEELLPFDGNEKEHVLIAVDQRIYDVTSARHHYGPGGSYAALAGRDASRSLAIHVIPKQKTKGTQEWDDLYDLSEKERAALNDWVAFFDFKYPRVGTLVTFHAWSGSGQEDQPDVIHGAILDSIDFEQHLKEAAANFDADIEGE